MYRILIVEDDEAEAAALRDCLQRYGRETGVELKSVWLTRAFDLDFERLPYDLVFMDINLPGVNGLEAAELMRQHDQSTPLVFVTNLAQYAVRGYEVDALDFIVKPVSYFDFKLRMDKAVRVMRAASVRSVVLTTRDGLRRVEVSRVVYVEVSNHNLVWHVDADGREDCEIRVRGTMRSAEESLAGAPFSRISNSCLLNMGYVRSIRGMELLTTTGDTVFFSRARRKAALEEITKYLCGRA